MLNKKEQRLRRSRQTRLRIAQQAVARLTVNRTNLHIYASVISDDGARVLASASTAEAEVRKSLGASGKGAMWLPHKPSVAELPRRHALPGSRKWLSTAPVLPTMAASRRWLGPPVKRACSFKQDSRYGQVSS